MPADTLYRSPQNTVGLARRAGDGYQDAIALKRMLEIRWIAVEADDVGALDDLLAMRRDGVPVADQVKFSLAPID